MGEENIARFNKRHFAEFVYAKLDKAIQRHHIFAILSIFLDEMMIELKNGKSIVFYNWGKLSLKQLPGRRHNDYATKKMIWSEGKKSFRFKVAYQLKKFLSARLDLDKTFKGD